MNRSRLLGVLVSGWMVLATIIASDVAIADTWAVHDDSEVTFVARITGSSFKATSEALTGKVELAPDASKVLSAAIQVEVKSLDTGMSMRNDHMRKKYLEAGKFPLIEFKAKESAVSIAEGATNEVVGTFTIHGVEKPVKLKLTVKESAGSKLVISGEFEVNILDYGIEHPKYFVVEMKPVVKVELTLVLEKK